MTIYLIRHGTTIWNTLLKIQGASDIPLDEVGEAIAKATGDALRRESIRFRHVFSSPLSRALRTAELVAPGAAICTDPRLTELSFGDFEGRLVPDMTNDPSCAFRHFKSDPFLYNEEIVALKKATHTDRADAEIPSRDDGCAMGTTEPAGDRIDAGHSTDENTPAGIGSRRYESLSDLLLRAESFVTEVIDPLALSEPEDTNILISGHGAVNKALLMAFAKKKDLHSFWGKGLQRNCGINQITSLRDSSGAVSYAVDETTRIYYDPEEFGGVRNLL